MRLIEAGLISKRSAKFSQSCISSTTAAGGFKYPENCLGGVIKRGQLGWLAQGPLLEVHSLRNGQKISSYHFDINLGFENCIITSVAEVERSELNCCLLAIGILFGDSPGSVVALFSVKESKVVRCIEVKEKVTCCAFVGPGICKRTVLHMFQGCLAVGTETGKIFLLDINLPKCEEVLLSTRPTGEDIELVPCHTVSSTLEFTHIRQHYKHSKQENVNFGIELERIENAGLILSMLSLTPLLTLAVGLEDGRMILYDLSELQPFYISYAPEKLSPLVKLAYMEPPDDPRACIYIWTYHENAHTAYAVMHSLMYDKKMTEDDGVCQYEGFQSCKVRLTLPMYEKGSLPVTCRTVSKYSNNDDEEILCLCLFSWKLKNLSHIILFDINQWYKEEMPTIGDWRDNLNYLAHFQIKDQNPLDVYVDPSTVASFNSIQRPEEHFYPISLCFDCIVMESSGSVQYHWPGLQNRALELLSSGGPTAILDPSYCFNEIMGASLMPLFSDQNYNSTFSINTQREILLSIALEYNCFGLLKECAKCWADGSCLGRRPYEGLSLSTLTEWIWSRAGKIKNRCNNLCTTLFDHSGVHIDHRSQKELSCLCRQLKLLADLYDVVLTKCKEYIPETELDTLSNQYNSIRTASEYQEVLQWLLNIGLLPEGYSESEDDKTYSRISMVPYPYKILKRYYTNQRTRFGKLNKGFISSRTQSCRILYIDSFIEHECNANVLRDHWMESGGNGLYPPPSLQAMLRTLLVPDVPIENKYVLFIYLFLDLNMAIEDESYSPIVQNLIKFPAVFKMNASLIKTVQAFWNLDHCQFEVALEEIISPFSQDRKLSQWQQELLIEALLAQDQPNLALQALQARVSPISSLLELKTLLANDLVAEAYHLQRSKNDPELLRTFLNGCLYLGKWGVLRDLALTEEEGKTVEEFLRQAKSANAENLHFVYLLQRSKYVEAISYLDELSKTKPSQRNADLETPNLVLSAYNLTMTPAVKQVSNVYCNIRNRIKPLKTGVSHPMPFSCELLKNGIRDISGGIYHSSALSTDQASIYWDDGVQKESNRLLDANNVPFIRQPQLDVGDLTVRESLSYPEIYKAVSKRRLNDSSDLDADLEDPVNNPSKKQKVIEGTDFVRSKKSFQTLNTSLLTRFKTKTLKDSNFKENSQSVTCSRQDSKEKSVHLLSTPFVKSKVDLKDDLDTIDNTYERVCTPHSILKVKSMLRTLSPSPTPFKSREHHESISKERPSAINTNEQTTSEIVDEEKSIRFDLPRRSDITVSSLENSPILKSNDTSLQLSGPQRRKPIRSLESSAISASDMDEFFSPIQSQDTSKVDEEMDIDSDAVERSREVQEEDENDEVEAQSDHEVEEQSSSEKLDKVEGNKISIDSTIPKQRLNMSDGPRARRPLRHSESPTEEYYLKKISDRRTRSRSRSKTPDIPSSPSRRSLRLAEKADRGIGSRKPLSRMVLEANVQKNVTTTIKDTENVITQTTTVSELNVEISQSLEATSSKEIIAKISDTKSLEFEPKATSTQGPSSLLKSHPWQDKIDDDVPTSLADECINVAPAPVPILADDSLLGESFTQNRDYHLMTTMDISSFSGGDVTLEEFEPPGNLLSDSESGDSKNVSVENDKKIVSKENNEDENSKEKDNNEKSVAENNSAAIDVEKEKEDRDEIKDKVLSSEKKNEEIDKKIDDNEKKLPEKQVENVKNNPENKEENSGNTWPNYWEEDEMCVDVLSEEVRDLESQNVATYATSSNRSTPIWLNENQSEESTEEDLSMEYSVESSESEEDNEKDVVVINISSTEGEDSSDSDVEETSPDKNSALKTNKEESAENIESSKDEDKDVSDLLYGDIDKDEEINVDDGKNENNDLNDVVIFEKISSTKAQVEISKKDIKPTSSTKSEKDSTVILEEQDTKTTSNEKEEYKEKEKSEQTLEISSVGSVQDVMTLNFLTGEEEVIEDAKNDKFDTHSFVKESQEPSSNATQSNRGVDMNISNKTDVTAMDVDEENLDGMNKSLNTSGIGGNIPQSEAKTIDEPKAEYEGVMESPKQIISSVPILIVSPPDDSNDGLQTEVEANEQSKNITSQIEEKSVEVQTDTKSIQPKSSESTESNVNYNNKLVEKSSEESEHPAKVDSALYEPSTSSNWSKRDQPSTSSGIVEHYSNSEKEENISDVLQSTVPSDNLDENIKLLISDEEDQVGTENKKSELINSTATNNKTPEKNLCVVDATTPSSHRVLRNRRARSESIEIESDLISTDLRTPDKFQRGKSVPHTELANTPKSKIRRLSESSSSYLSPSRILTRRQSQILERIEEDNSLDSPAKHTRSRVRLNSNDSDQAINTQEMENKKRSRRSSISSVGTPEKTVTPRTSRARSVLSEDNVPATPKRSLKRLSISRENLNWEETKLSKKDKKIMEDEEMTSDEETSNEKSDKDLPKSSKIAKKTKKDESSNDQKRSDIKEEKSKVKTSKKIERILKENAETSMEVDTSSTDEVTPQKSSGTPIKSSKSIVKPTSSKTSKKNKNETVEKASEFTPNISLTEELSASRRLTRNQLSILEKSLSSPIAKVEAKRIPKRRPSNELDSHLKKANDESEVESIASSRSRRSSIDSKRRTTRSSVKEQQDDDASSVASSTISKRSTQSKRTSRRSSKVKSLKSIPEENVNNSASSENESENSPKQIAKKKGRPGKLKK